MIVCESSPKSGAGTRNRTADLLITNQSLYQLSYPGLLLARKSAARWGGEYSEGTTTSERVLLNETQIAVKSASSRGSLMSSQAPSIATSGQNVALSSSDLM